ncbi:MAG: lipid-A-disaccharide synthase [Leptolyngbya foveolarum]|uniref:Lipid-A-disaccharide synthase n=1 Tax=Leptolyngbya foveolarum TaxID=47253 RepID=A0A2W4USU6_9CYAN|nr:MAG: lipid-A-disaccharide synthase [Leptolyngbya foveolarum]
MTVNDGGAGDIEPIDVVILSNGPGEVATWVKPVVRSLRKSAPNHTKLRISVLLSPCPNASGQEHIILARYPEVDRVQSAEHFFRFLLTGKTLDGWDWHDKGVVVFLGGDQLYTLLVAKRLGYGTAVYAEWEARWASQIDCFGVMRSGVAEKVSSRYRDKLSVVGDLMADVQTMANRAEIMAALALEEEAELIGFLPGSKPAKLGVGVPLSLAIAHYIHQQRPQSQFVIGVAPNLSLDDLASYANPAINPAVSGFSGPEVSLVTPHLSLPYFQITNGPKVYLWQRFPALDLFSQCALCFTTVGANTAQLGALATPMIVMIPTQGLENFKMWDGLPGLIVRLPGVGAIARKVINPLIIRTAQKAGKLFAWPNIWAKKEVVPELFGYVTAQDVSEIALDYLTHPEKLDEMRRSLRGLRGSANAADKMADLILETVNYVK